MLRWLIQRDVIDIPKSVKNERMKQNIDVFGFKLTYVDMLKIAILVTKKSTIHDQQDLEIVRQIATYKMDEK